MKQLIIFEWKKLFFKRSILLVLVLFSLINVWKIYDTYTRYSYLTEKTDEKGWGTVYWQLYLDYQGVITSERIERLLSVYQPLLDKTQDMTANTDTNNPDTMTGNVYSDRNLLEKYYVKPMEYFYQYSLLAQQVTEKAQNNVIRNKEIGNLYEARKNAVIYNLYKDREISEFAYTEMYNYYLNYDFSIILLLLLALYGVSRVFFCERETQMDMLLLVGKNGGKKLCWVKVIVTSFYLVAMSVWFSVLDFLSFSVAFGTVEGAKLPVYAIETFAGTYVNMNLFQFVICSGLVRALGIWTFGMIFLLISKVCKKAIVSFSVSMSISVVLVCVGALSAFYSGGWNKVFNLFYILANKTLFAKCEFVNIFDYPVLVSIAAIVFCIFMGIIAVVLNLIFTKQNTYCSRKKGGPYEKHSI